MLRFDHLSIPVANLTRSRSWYVDTLGLTVEFEVPDRQTVALQDSSGFTIFLQEVAEAVTPNVLCSRCLMDATFCRVAGARRCSRMSPVNRTGAMGLS
jgi:hypothetical protein